MPRKAEPKRYENERQILDDIDKNQQAIKHYREQSEVLSKFADVLRDHPNFTTHGTTTSGVKGSKYVLPINEYREIAGRSLTRASNLEKTKAKKLQQALATMRTGVFPEIVGDESISKA